MDKELLAGLNNLSEAILTIADTLQKKDAKSATGNALKSVDLSKQLRQISVGIREIKKDTQKILNQQDTILKMLKKDEVKETTSQKVSKGQTNVETAKEKKDDERTKFIGSIDTRKVKDGVSAVLMIAVGVVAIGLSLKILGKIDFLSVLGIALALPLIAIAFSKISSIFTGGEVTDEKGRKIRTAKLDRKDIPTIIFSIVAFSTAITLSSYILSKVKPIGLLQGISAIMIAGVFALMGPSLGKVINAFYRINMITALKASLFLPVVLVAVSAAIMGSSYFISNVKPIGLLQAFSSIMIAGVFAVISMGLGKLISAFGRINPISAFLAARMLPVVLLAVSVSIMLASFVLSAVKPVGLLQAITSIVIAGVFTVISFGIGKIISAFRRVDPVTALAAATLMPILFVAISASIMASSYLLSQVKPIGLLQAITSIAISAVLVVLSFGIAKMIPAFRRIKPSEAVTAALMMPIVFTSLSFSILLSSKFLYQVKPIGILQFLTSIAISTLFVGFAFAAGLIVKWTKNLKTKDVLFGSFVVLTMTTTVALAGFIISKSTLPGATQIFKFIGFSIALGVTTIAIAGTLWALKKINIGIADIVKGGIAILAIATTIMLTSLIVSLGTYDKYPSLKWILGVGASVVGFGLAAVVLGTIAMSGVGALAILAGLASILAIAGTIVLVDKIISMGTFTKFPGLKWITGVGASMIGFGLAAVTLGGLIVGSLGLGAIAIAAGLAATLKIAENIVDTDRIISTGKYDKFPSREWVSSVGDTLLKFSTAVVTLGAIDSVGGIASTLSFGLVKNPIDSGIEATLKISQSIVDIDRILSKGRYTGGPTSKWSSGISMALSAFWPIYKILLENSGWFSSGVSPDDFSKAIRTISQGIVDSASYFNSAKPSFENGPTVDWVDGVGRSITKFVDLYNITKDLDVDDLGKIWTMASHIKGISTELSYGNYNNTISDGFIKGVDKGFNLVFNLINRFKRVNIIDTAKIFLAAKTITTLSNSFERAKFQKYPSERWIKGIETTFNKFKNVILTINKSSFSIYKDGILKIKAITDLIIWIDNKISLGRYKKWPEKIWSDKTSKSILQFGQLSDDIDKRFGIVELYFGLNKAREIAKSIRDISLNIENGTYNKYPSLEWSMAVPKAIAGFMNIPFKGVFGTFFEWIFGTSEDEKKSQLGKIVDMMLYVDDRFKSGNFKNYPTVSWVEGTVLALQKFSNIVSLLSFSSIGDSIMSQFGFGNPIVSAVSNIEKLAISFDKLSKSLKSFSDSIKEIDNEKLSTINSLSSNVILLSLMDPEQFDKMMSKLEDRSGVFAELVKDFEGKRKQMSSGSVTTTITQPTKEQPKNLELQQISQKMDTMNALLADISSVVGSRGTLKSYLAKIKDDVNIGGNNTNLTARSDRRLKNIIKKLGVSNLGINIYAFTYKFDPNTVYQGVMAQELIGKFDSALLVDKNGVYSVDYSKIDVEFKKTNI